MNKQMMREVVAPRIDMLLSPFDHIAKTAGFDALYAICEMFGGSNSYIPTIKSVCRGCLEDAAQQDYNGRNFRALQMKYGYSESHLRNLLKRNKKR